jgi:integrase
MTDRTRRRGWLETIEPGVYRRHRADCASSRDRRPRRRCSCPLTIAVPGSRPRATTLETLEPGATLTAARNLRRTRQGAGRRAEAVPAPATVGTVHELAVTYLRAKTPLLAPSTITTTEDAYRLRIAPHLRDASLAELNRARVEAWLGTLLKAGDSSHAARKALAALRVMCSYAVELGELSANPCSRVRVPQPPADPDAPPPVERVLTPLELELVLAACKSPREEAIVRLAAESGLRSGEVRGLRWPDVDLNARRLLIRRSVWRRATVKLPKSGKQRRVAMTATCSSVMTAPRRFARRSRSTR